MDKIIDERLMDNFIIDGLGWQLLNSQINLNVTKSEQPDIMFL